MSAPPLAAHAALLAMVAAGGMLLGWGYFEALRRSIAWFGAPAGRARSVALTAGRLLCAVGFFALIARLGALPLLLALAGFLAARSLALRTARRAP